MFRTPRVGASGQEGRKQPLLLPHLWLLWTRCRDPQSLSASSVPKEDAGFPEHIRPEPSTSPRSLLVFPGPSGFESGGPATSCPLTSHICFEVGLTQVLGWFLACTVSALDLAPG